MMESIFPVLPLSSFCPPLLVLFVIKSVTLTHSNTTIGWSGEAKGVIYYLPLLLLTLSYSLLPLPHPSPSPFFLSTAFTGGAVKRRVSYFYDPEIGNYHYGQGHPMKPHRVRMTHNLVVNYGLYRKMDVFRPKLVSAAQLTIFHSDDYINFLRLITPGKEQHTLNTDLGPHIPEY